MTTSGWPVRKLCTKWSQRNAMMWTLSVDSRESSS
jgi:hypothetical protein